MKRWYLVKARDELGLTMDEVAKRLGVSRQMVCQTENGISRKSGLSIGSAMKLSVAYELPFSYVCEQESRFLSC